MAQIEITSPASGTHIAIGVPITVTVSGDPMSNCTLAAIPVPAPSLDAEPVTETDATTTAIDPPAHTTTIGPINAAGSYRITVQGSGSGKTAMVVIQVP